MTDKKEIKISFAPGAFDQFEGTQEELDQMIAEIHEMFANKTPEELEAMGRLMTEEDFEDMDDEARAQIIRARQSMDEDEEDLEEEFKRKLQ